MDAKPEPELTNSEVPETKALTLDELRVMHFGEIRPGETRGRGRSRVHARPDAHLHRAVVALKGWKDDAKVSVTEYKAALADLSKITMR